MQNVNVGPNSGSTNSTSSGMFNTIISPINLGWNFHPFFFKVGFSVYLNDGDTNHGTSSVLPPSPTISTPSSRISP